MNIIIQSLQSINNFTERSTMETETKRRIRGLVSTALDHYEAENSAPIASPFKESDPAAHILPALASLGEGIHPVERIAQRAGEPIVKVRYLLDALRILGYVRKLKAGYKLKNSQLGTLIDVGIV